MSLILDSEDEKAEALAFRERCRPQMARPIDEQMRDGFCCVYWPVLEDVGVRVFSTTRKYREWCAAKLPVDLGFQPVSEE